MAVSSINPTPPNVQPPNLLHQMKASTEARGVGIRLHLADVQLGRQANENWSALDAGMKANYDFRGTVALNTGDVERLDRAREQAAVAIRLRVNPDIVQSIEVARVLADIAIGEWLRTMAGERGR